ncbi:phosphatase PAP2 family protein [Actinomycetes bacterium KLBMP 9797]
MTAVAERSSVRAGSVLLPAAWLVLVAAAQAAALVAVWRFFVRTERGQRLDTVALAGNRIGRDEVDGVATAVLDAMSVAAIAIAVVVIAVIALARGRVLLTVAVTGFVAGATATTQILKYGLYRPDFGVDPERASAGNSFPSGHATVAVSVAIALVLVLPSRVRGVAALAGAAYAAVAGVATMTLGWHRPSDVIGAALVAGAWAAAAGLLLVVAQGRDVHVRDGAARPWTVAFLLVGAAVLLAAAAGAVDSTADVLATPVDELGRRRLFTAYAGAAAGIVGAVAAVMALVLAAAHRIAPTRP